MYDPGLLIITSHLLSISQQRIKISAVVHDKKLCVLVTVAAVATVFATGLMIKTFFVNNCNNHY